MAWRISTSSRKFNPQRAFTRGEWLYPAMWSFMLAARRRGLGAVTSGAAELLGIPFDSVIQGGPVSVACHTGETFRPAGRPWTP